MTGWALPQLNISVTMLFCRLATSHVNEIIQFSKKKGPNLNKRTQDYFEQKKIAHLKNKTIYTVLV